MPEGAVLATLSRVVPRNLLAKRIVKIIANLPDFKDQLFWFEVCMGFANLRPDKHLFKMELLREMDLATVSDERRAELLFAFDVLVAEGEKRGHEKGFDEGEKHGKRQMRIEMAQKMLAEGFDVEQVMRLTGLSRDEVTECL
jgi:hypothetical protein